MANNVKRTYYLNNKQVKKTTFYNSLKNHSLTKQRTYSLGNFGCDVYDFDKKKFNAYCRKLNGHNGYAPITLGFKNNGKTEMFRIEKRRK
ncbi:MAG: hypothetical protein IJA61_02090 [Clostridia bacterium]|nr:hypothetical protein [Clostridia bacterium]